MILLHVAACLNSYLGRQRSQDLSLRGVVNKIEKELEKMFLSRKDFITLQQIQADLQGYNASLLADILQRLEDKQAAENKKVAQKIKERRKINPLYSRSTKERAAILARKAKEVKKDDI